MPPGETTAPITPADRRRRRNRNLVVLAGFVFLVASLLLGTVLAVNEGRNFKRLMSAAGFQVHTLPPTLPAPLAIKSPQRLTSLPPHLKRLIALPQQIGEAFIHIATASPAAQCANLGKDLPTPSKFQQQGFDWECTMLQQFGNGDDPSALFAQLRGADDNAQFSSFRLKMSFTERGQDAPLEKAANTILQRITPVLSPDTMSYLTSKIHRRAPFKADVDEYRATFEPEMLDGRRFNLLLLPMTERTPCPADAQQTSAVSRLKAATRISCAPLGRNDAFGSTL